MNFVAVDQRAAPAALGGEAVGEHGHHGVELRARERPIGPRPPDEGEQLVFRVLATRGFGDDLLSKHIARRVVRHDAIQLSSPNRSDERHALDKIVARGRKHPALRRAGHRVSRSTHTLQERCDAMWRSNLAHEVDVTDVYSEFQRRRGDERLERAALEPRFRVEPPLFRQASVVCGHCLVAKAVAEVASQALGKTAGIDEHERRAMCSHEIGEAVVVLLPDLAGHHRFERRLGQLEREVERTAMAFVDDGAVGVGRVSAVTAVADEEPGDGLDGDCVADRPMRRSGASATSCRRSSDSARCAPRRVPITA